MENKSIIITMSSFAFLFLSCTQIMAKKQKTLESNLYQDAPQLFQAEYGVTGKYWSKSKKRPAQAYVGDQEYINIVVIKAQDINNKNLKKLRKHKEYLGSYLSPKTNLEYNIYGVNKNPYPDDNGPDSDVRTVIAIKQDTGMGE
jgi:hypothetical protein